MSRRKQTTPNKVHWTEVFGRKGVKGTAAMMKTNFPEALGDQRPALHPLQDPDSSSSGSDDEETTQDEVSSHTSEEDGSVVKVKKELENAEQPVAAAPLMRENEASVLNADPMLGLSQCPLCQLECRGREQLIAHVYQHTAAVVSAKSYMCPVCGRALSSPGSLGRHLLIHSEDQLSNCAVCGARFTSHATFNSAKLPEVLSADRLPAPQSQGPSSAEGKDIAFHPAVYPAAILLVCNNCTVYRRLLEAQAPSVRKWAL
ncbi:Zinc finger protein 821, partial [Nestor notabilis]